MLKLVVYSPDTPPRRVAEINERQLGHLELFHDDELLAHVVLRAFADANEVEVGVADASWEWLARTRMPMSASAT